MAWCCLDLRILGILSWRYTLFVQISKTSVGRRTTNSTASRNDVRNDDWLGLLPSRVFRHGLRHTQAYVHTYGRYVLLWREHGSPPHRNNDWCSLEYGRP